MLTYQRYQLLIEQFGTLDTALQHLDENLLKGLGCKSETIYKALNRFEEFDPTAYADELQKRAIQFVFLDDPEYPELLRTIPDPPVFLYYQGDLAVVKQPCVGLVGTRQISQYGHRVTEAFVPPIVQTGAITVSGLAQGIDTAVALETIANNGKTVAVLGHGLAGISPVSNRRLAQKIVESGGVLISEFALDVPADKYTFPARNRIIAGLSLGTVVLEAGQGSGALITADLALDYGRDVFAVPGQVFDANYVGCHQAIAKGQAKLVTTATEVLQELGMVVGSATATTLQYEPQNELDGSIFTALTSMPQSVEELVEKIDADVGQTNACLTVLEMQGVAKNVGGGQWVRG